MRLAARGHCFRNEVAGELVPGRRQIEFRDARADPDRRAGLDRGRAGGHAGGDRAGLPAGFGLSGEWLTGNDPFFMPGRQGQGADAAPVRKPSASCACRMAWRSRASTAMALSSASASGFPNPPGRPCIRPASPSAWTAGPPIRSSHFEFPLTAISPAEVLPRLRRRLPRLAPHLNPDAPISELGLDSMDTVELLCAIHEEFGVRLGEDEFQRGVA